MDNLKKVVAITQLVDANEFWSAVFGAEPFIWPWWVNVRYAEDTDWETSGTVTITIADPDDAEDSTTKTLTLDDIVAAYVIALEQYPHSVGGVGWSHTGFDTESSDLILQIAVQGEVVFG